MVCDDEENLDKSGRTKKADEELRERVRKTEIATYLARDTNRKK